VIDSTAKDLEGALSVAGGEMRQTIEKAYTALSLYTYA